LLLQYACRQREVGGGLAAVAVAIGAVASDAGLPIRRLAGICGGRRGELCRRGVDLGARDRPLAFFARLIFEARAERERGARREPKPS
jgi:hypothetical protein